MNSVTRTLGLRVIVLGILSATAGKMRADAYRVFDWQGMAAPAMPTENPPGAGAMTFTTYLKGGQCREGGVLAEMDVEIDVSAALWDAPSRWRVDPEGFLSGGNVATYGYQSPDEAEFNFGNPNGRTVMRFDVHFGQPVNNPSFFLLDVDNNGSDHGTQFEGTILGGGIVYPTLSLTSGTTVAWTGWGSTLDIFSIGGAVADNQANGAAFFEWHQNNVTDFSFVWESSAGTNIRMSNIYAEYDPAGFAYAVPEPSSWLLVLMASGALRARSRRRTP